MLLCDLEFHTDKFSTMERVSETKSLKKKKKKKGK